MSVWNLRAHPEVMLLCQADRTGDPDGLLRVQGTAVVHRRIPSFGELMCIALKYYLPPGGLRSELANLSRHRLRQRHCAQSQPAVIEVTPHSAELLPRPG